MIENKPENRTTLGEVKKSLRQASSRNPSHMNENATKQTLAHTNLVNKQQGEIDLYVNPNPQLPRGNKIAFLQIMVNKSSISPKILCP